MDEVRSPIPSLDPVTIQELVSRQSALEKRNAELESELKKFVIYYDHAPVGYFTLNCDAVILEANQTASTLLWLPRHEIVGSSFFDFILPEYQEICSLRCKSLFETHQHQVCEVKLYRDVETSFWAQVEAAIYTDPDTGVSYSQLMISDISERKAAEEDLNKKSTELNSFFDTSLDLLCIADLKGHFIHINAEWESTLGFSPDKLIGHNYLDFVHPEDYQSTHKAIESLASGNEVKNFINRTRCRDGSYRYLEWRAAPSGKLIFTAGRDVTDMVLSVSALKKSESSFRNKLSAILEPDNTELKLGLSDVVDMDSLSGIMNDFYHLTGILSAILDVSGNVLIKAGWQDICTKFHRVNPISAKNCLESDTILTKGVPAGEFRVYRCRNNLWDMATPIYVDNQHLGNVYVGQFFYEDEAVDVELFRQQARDYGYNEAEYLAALEKVPRFTKEKIETAMFFFAKLASLVSSLSFSRINLARTLVQQQQSEQNYSTLFNEMLDGLALHEIILDEEGTPVNYRFLAVNPAFERLTGLKKENVLGSTIKEVLPKSENYWFEVYGRVALTGEPVSFNHYSADLDRHFEIRAFRPAAMQFVCVFSDVTEQIRIEAERARLQEQLSQAQKMESIGRLAGGVAHDFNNMLGIILGHTDMALGQLDESLAVYADLEEVRKAASRSAELTKQLLAFARKQTIAPKVLDLNSTVADMLKMLQRMIGESIELDWNPGQEQLPVKIDPSQIDQIMANLCINASDAINGNGRVIIETKRVNIDQSYNLVHNYAEAGSYAMLTMSDNGCGMDKATLARLFEPFFTTKDFGKGTGLGLATVYGIVKQNSGFVDVYSEPGTGSCFKIYLPIHDSAVSQETSEVSTMVENTGNETILLVEDEPAILKMSKKMLERFGYRVISASSPREALNLPEVELEAIDLLITDVIMPEMNGVELAKKLQEVNQDLHCLFMSGYTDDIINNHKYLHGKLFFIPKPFTSKQLGEKVREAVSKD